MSKTIDLEALSTGPFIFLQHILSVYHEKPTPQTDEI